MSGVTVLLLALGGWAWSGARLQIAFRTGLAQASVTGLTADQSVDARLLVLTASAADSGLAALAQELDRAGTPYVVVDLSAAPLSATSLSDGASHGNFNGIILTSSNVIAAAGAGWNALVEYMTAFQVRHAVLFANPQQVEGFAPGAISLDTGPGAPALQFTAAAADVFGYAAAPVPVLGVGAWAARPAGSATVPLLVDAAGDVLVATHRFDDGREALHVMFEQTPDAVHSLQLLHGVVAWVTRGIYVGEKRIYLNPQLDDMFLGNFATDGSNYRVTGDELRIATEWVRARRATAVGAGLVLTLAFNGSGTNDADPLLQAARAVGREYFWVSHTFSHLTLNTVDYASALQDLRANDDFMKKEVLGPYDAEDLVPPSISGLFNAAALRAMKDFGIRYLICDTSRPGCTQAVPNLGIPSPDEPSILMVPRRPTALFSYVSTPAEWVVFYNTRYRKLWGKDLTVDEIVEFESDIQAGYVLRGEIFPWMFHQGNLRAYDGKRSLLTDLLGRTLDKVGQVLALPVNSIPMSEIGRRMRDRAARDPSGVVATIGPGDAVTLRATGAVRVPITGARAADSEVYGGMVISHVEVPAGGSVTVPLAAVAAQASTAVDGSSPPVPASDGAAPEDAAGRTGGGGGCAIGGAPGTTSGAPGSAWVMALALALAALCRKGATAPTKSRPAGSRRKSPTRF